MKKNHMDIIKEKTDWNAEGQADTDKTPGRPCLDFRHRQCIAISNWLAHSHSCGMWYQAPYGMYYKMMKSDYVLLDYVL